MLLICKTEFDIMAFSCIVSLDLLKVGEILGGHDQGPRERLWWTFVHKNCMQHCQDRVGKYVDRHF